jgi:putative lipoic acid-binding regulatory protein
MIDLNQHQVQIDYPCSWKYKVVILCEHKIKHIVNDVLEDRKHTCKPSKKSSKGKFESHTIELVVENEEDRKGIFHQFSSHEKVKMVV